ncbi:hypothetical protein ACLXNF_04215 [Mycobacteroides chelonae]|uniref:hypothetical protein n=1 Tax=Mycobacteroides chelonae TaxID=1774 RepID=UPI0039ED2E79
MEVSDNDFVGMLATEVGVGRLCMDAAVRLRRERIRAQLAPIVNVSVNLRTRTVRRLDEDRWG